MLDELLELLEDAVGANTASRHPCAYYARYYGLPGCNPNATCTEGCWDEPRCVTDEPIEGWGSFPDRQLPTKETA